MNDQGGQSPRAPSAVLVVDANIILSVVLGRRSRPLFERVIASRIVVTSAHVADEVRAVARVTPGLPRDTGKRIEALLGVIGVANQAVYTDLVEGARRVLSRAVASRNGSTNDAHLLACAWAFDADLWSHDRDFAGTGWPSWSNANLNNSVGEETAI
jgi:predicted nucleic acid-binding protein